MKKTTLLLVAIASQIGCAAVPPKVQISQEWHGDEKNVRTLMQQSGQENKASGQKLYNVWVNVCDVQEGNAEVGCKESKVLEDVLPGSLY